MHHCNRILSEEQKPTHLQSVVSEFSAARFVTSFQMFEDATSCALLGVGGGWEQCGVGVGVGGV